MSTGMRLAGSRGVAGRGVAMRILWRPLLGRLVPALAALMVASSLVASANAPLLNETFDSLNSSTWTITDSQNKLSANGRLVGGPRSPATWNDPALVGTTTYARVAGRALVANVLHRDVARSGPVIGWTAGPLPADPRQATHGLLAQAFTLQAATGNPLGALGLGSGQTLANMGTALTNTEYLYTIVLRPQGAYYFASTLPNGTHAAWPQASLVWVDNVHTASNLAPFISNVNQEFIVDDLRVVDFGGSFASAYGLAAAADTFTRADGPLSGSSTESGGGAWAVANGAWAVSNNQLTLSANGTGPAVATVVGAADGIFEATLQTPPSGPVSAGLIVRASNASTYLLARLRSDRVQLVQVQGGSETILSQTGYNVAPNSLYRLVVRANGSTVRVYVNDREPFGSPTTTTFNQTATGIGVHRASEAGIDGGTRLDEVAAWPSTVTLPPDAGVGPYGGSAGSTTVEQQAWSAMAVPPDDWVRYTRQWYVTSGQLNTRDLIRMLIKNYNRGDADVATDVTLPNSNINVLAGLTYRARDINNLYFVRLQRFANSAQIDLELGRIVNGSGAIQRYIPVTGIISMGQTVLLRVVTRGPWATIYLNNRPEITYYDPALQAETKYGMYSDPSGLSVSWDNWLIKAVP